MSFLFGKKSKEAKGQTTSTQRSQDAQSAPGPGSSIPAVNGLRPKERGAGLQSPTPGAGANVSASSIENGTTPSPEHGQGQRGRQDSDLSVCRCSSINLREPAEMMGGKRFGSLLELVRKTLTLGLCSVAHGPFPTGLLQVSIQQRFIPGLSDNLALLPRNQIHSPDTVRQSMPSRPKKETYT